MQLGSLAASSASTLTQLDLVRPFAVHRRARRLVCGAWLDEPQHARPLQGRELRRVAPVGLDPVADADGHQRRSAHIACHVDARAKPPQREPARPGPLADSQSLRAAEPRDQSTDRLLRRLDPHHVRTPAAERQRRRHDRELVHVQRHKQPHIGGLVKANVRHGLVLQGRIRLWPKLPLSPHKSTRNGGCYERGPASVPSILTRSAQHSRPVAPALGGQLDHIDPGGRFGINPVAARRQSSCAPSAAAAARGPNAGTSYRYE
jgi:hypothetical protein